jgi:hypothetical protein
MFVENAVTRTYADSCSPTGRTRSLAEASRDRHIAEAVDIAKYGKLKEGFHAESTLADSLWFDKSEPKNAVSPAEDAEEFGFFD